jgi:hypothetical protein
MSTYKERFLLRHEAPSKQDRAFLEWIDEVETIVKRDTGFALMDITDMPYYPSFEMGVDAKEMAKITIESVYGFR